jgi:hypothetical protein
LYSNSTDARASVNTSVTTSYTTTAITSSFVRFTATFTVPTDAVGLKLQVGSSGTPIGNTQTLDWSNFQLEVGSVPTPFTRAGGTLQGELSAAQRYYVRFTNGGAYQAIGNGSATATTGISSSVPLPVQMRTTPSSIDVGTLGFADGVNAIITGTIALIASQSSPTKAYVAGSSLSASATQFRFYELITNNSATGFLGVNAEL